MWWTGLSLAYYAYTRDMPPDHPLGSDRAFWGRFEKRVHWGILWMYWALWRTIFGRIGHHRLLG
jgi:hypothetical protein